MSMLLCRACVDGDSYRVKTLIDNGADVNGIDIIYRSPPPLITAVLYKHLDIVQLLLQHNADPNLNDRHGESPLYKAILMGESDIARVLLIYGANPNFGRIIHGDQPLLNTAIWRHNQDMVKLLLQYGANPNIQNHAGDTPLHRAIEECTRKTKTFFDIEEFNQDIIKILLQNGANPNIKNYEGKIPEDLTSDPAIKNLIREPSSCNIKIEKTYNSWWYNIWSYLW